MVGLIIIQMDYDIKIIIKKWYIINNVFFKTNKIWDKKKKDYLKGESNWIILLIKHFFFLSLITDP